MQAESSSQGAAEAALPLFARGIVSLLACWPALRIAVTHNWIPKKQASNVDSKEYAPETAAEKRTRLAEELVDAYFSSFTESSDMKIPDQEEIEDFLFEFIEVEYGVALEDASEIQIAKDCRELWQDALTGRMENILKFERMATKAREEDNDPTRAMRGTRTGDQDNGDDSSSSEEEDVSHPHSHSHAQGDGMDIDDEPSASTSAAHPGRQEPEVDEDGFTTVVKPKKGGRR